MNFYILATPGKICSYFKCKNVKNGKDAGKTCEYLRRIKEVKEKLKYIKGDKK